MATVFEIQTLYVKITANATEYFSQTQKVIEQSEKVVSSFTRISTASTALRSAIYQLVFAFGALAGVMIPFAKFDEQLTNIAIHTQDWSQAMRPIMERGLLALGKDSVFSVMELGRGFDVLAKNGRSVGMAMRELKMDEEFAAGAGLNLSQATADLVRIQNQLGLSSTNVEEHLKNLRMIQDAFNGSVIGTTVSVKDMMDSFGGRSIAAMKAVGWEFK